MKPVAFNSPRKIRAYLKKAFEDGDPSVITSAMGDVARATNVSRLAQQTHLRREALYRSLSPDGNPMLSTLVKVLDAWGLKLQIALKTPADALEIALTSGPATDDVEMMDVAIKKHERRRQQ